MKYNCRGNVRELENVIEYTYVSTIDSNIFKSSKLSALVKEKLNKKSENIFHLKEILFESQKFIKDLEANNWNMTKAANN